MTEHLDGGIPHSVLDTRGLPGKQAFTLWREHAGLFYDVRAPKDYPQTFDVRADVWHVGNVLIGDFRVPAQDWSRSRACIGRDGVDLFMVQILRKGWSGPRDGGAAVHANDILVYDMSQPTDRRGGDNQALTLFLPRNLLGPHLAAPDEHNLHLLPSSDPLAALLRDHLIGLQARLPKMSLDQAQAIIHATVQLTTAALNGKVQDEQAGPVRIAMTERICSYINANIRDPDLDPETIAGRFGMTRRNLAYLFESHGGVAAYIRRRRLSLIRSALVHPAHREQSIETIAEAHGFGHYRSFALAFQRQFGLTPRELRAHGLEGNALSSASDDNLAEWAHWIRRMT
ncbi:helix-turn-helix domain-containing protein [Bradyrhizobium manausense]|uniref:helix-turn-helix domain-containing protein n=1 Tax=Bradyrhizobium TaxID=374 RepID=UPI001BA90469|nr:MULTISPECIES: helix-turn-helix domain-containing protein [Bradyrhizobium]MBR0828007.1 helix-turn-helix domain-containing protein [Bradyrhizobium manausense]UVO32870.1 helix-turn-helix domain-containing protein [Bradyrhizobium arachidis]